MHTHAHFGTGHGATCKEFTSRTHIPPTGSPSNHFLIVQDGYGWRDTCGPLSRFELDDVRDTGREVGCRWYAVIIHTLYGRWPFPNEAFHPDPQNPDAIIPVSEVERRAEYLQEIGNDHPLMGLIHRCLSNMPTRRPEALALLERVNAILSTLPQSFTNRVEMLQQFETHIQTLIDTNQSKQSDIDSLRVEVERLSVRNPSQQVHSQPSHTGQPDTQTQV